MPTQSATIVQRLWNYCNVLRDDGVLDGDYVGRPTDRLSLTPSRPGLTAQTTLYS